MELRPCSTPASQIVAPFWRPGHDQIVFTTDAGDGPVYHLINGDGTSAAPDRRRVARCDQQPPSFRRTGPASSTRRGLTVLVCRAGSMSSTSIPASTELLMFEGSEGTSEFPYPFSPDGSKLAARAARHRPSYEVNGEFGYRLVVAPADGEGPDIPIGPAIPSATGGATAEFSPDGTQVLAFYNARRRPGCSRPTVPEARKSTGTRHGAFNWQRLAP